MMQNTASVTGAMGAGAEGYQGNPGQPRTGPVPGEQAMGSERGVPGGSSPAAAHAPGGETGCSCEDNPSAQGNPGPVGMTGPQAMPGMQGMPQGMTGPQGMPGVQGMPQGMTGGFTAANPHAYSGMPFSGQGAPSMGYQQPPPQSQAPGPSPHVHDHGPSPDHGPRHPKHDAHQYGQFMGLVNDLANGSADPSRVMAYLGSQDAQFWKGALVGISVVLLLTNDTVKNAIVGTLSGILGAFSKETEKEQSK